ncbi:hypothetical protein [Actinocorallia longicatena]
MDKPNKDGSPRVDLLQFARLRSMGSLPEDKRSTLRGMRQKLQPFEALFVGEVADLGESFILLSDPYFLPASYFGLEFINYKDHPEADPEIADYVTPVLRDSRVECLDEGQISLLRQKMAAFWARVQADK